MNRYTSVPITTSTWQVTTKVNGFVLQDAIVSQIVFKQFHIIIHTVLIRLLHQGAKLLLFSPRWMEYHQGVKVDSRVCVLLCNICQAAIDAKLERQQLYHTRTPLRDEVELTPANLHQEEE